MPLDSVLHHVYLFFFTSVVLMSMSDYPVSVDVLPLPKLIVFDYLGLKSVDLKLINNDNVILQQAFETFTLQLPHTKNASSQAPFLSIGLSYLEFNVVDTQQDLQFEANESYRIDIGSSSNTVNINCETTWGCLHGLKTLQQLLINDNGVLMIELAVLIVDEPSLSHRGVLIDTGRNFLLPEVIKTNIDLMSFSKLNVLHWHIVDSQSWPLQLLSYPEMTKDAYSSQEVYDQDTIRHIVDYARTKGVRVIPEIDLPGHSRAGYRSINNLLIVCGDFDSNWSQGAVEPPAGQLDILNNETYTVVSDIFNEVNSLFPDNYFHVGHDELNQICYNQSLSIKQYLENGHSFRDLVQYWLNRTLPTFLNDSTTSLIMWEDVVTSEHTTIPKDKVILQNWLGSDSINTLTSQGYDVIVSNSEQLYLDCGFGNWIADNTNFKSWCDPYKTWQSLSSYDMFFGLNEKQSRHIKGTEVALWGETVDSTNVLTKIWPRTLGFAENSWSGPVDIHEFVFRINHFRDYLAKMYPIGPLGPKYCSQNPGHCIM